jgi:hypothetical protein
VCLPDNSELRDSFSPPHLPCDLFIQTKDRLISLAMDGNGDETSNPFCAILCASHIVSVSIAFWWNWSSISRRLSRSTLPIVANYATASLALLIAIWLIYRRREVNLRTATTISSLLPYFSALTAFFSSEVPRWYASGHYPDILSIFFIGMFAPYLVLWGPVVSIANLTVIMTVHYVGVRSGQ